MYKTMDELDDPPNHNTAPALEERTNSEEYNDDIDKLLLKGDFKQIILW